MHEPLHCKGGTILQGDTILVNIYCQVYGFLDSGHRVLLPCDCIIQQFWLLQGEESQRRVVPAHQLGRRVQGTSYI